MELKMRLEYAHMCVIVVVVVAVVVVLMAVVVVVIAVCAFVVLGRDLCLWYVGGVHL